MDRSKTGVEPARWWFQDAKARLSELTQRVESEGPQHVTVGGRDAVIVIAAEECQGLQAERSGRSLVDAMQSSPYPDVEIEPSGGSPMPVRGVVL